MCFDASKGFAHVARAATASVDHECLRRGSIASGAAALARAAPSFDCKAPMDYRTPLQQLLRTLRPSRDPAAAPDPAPAPDFVDTRPDEDRRASTTTVLRTVAPPQRPQGAWAESALDLVLGTEIMEYPEDTAADLMDEFFAKSEKRAA
jgi:hypothetical protein